jgi:hypothetical protein
VDNKTIILEEGETALFGYGSLINQESLEFILKKKYTGPYVSCILPGWRRTWDAVMANDRFFWETDSGRVYPRSIIYLNVTRDPGTTLNGVVFVVDSEQLTAMDARESIYVRRDITEDLWGITFDGGRCYVYIAKPECLLGDSPSPAIAAVRETYLHTIDSGLDAWGDVFKECYARSTDAVPEHLVIPDKRAA